MAEHRLSEWLPTTKKEVELRGWETLDVIYNPNMKALGLHNLVLLYIEYTKNKDTEQA